MCCKSFIKTAGSKVKNCWTSSKFFNQKLFSIWTAAFYSERFLGKKKENCVILFMEWKVWNCDDDGIWRESHWWFKDAVRI